MYMYCSHQQLSLRELFTVLMAPPGYSDKDSSMTSIEISICCFSVNIFQWGILKSSWLIQYKVMLEWLGWSGVPPHETSISRKLETGDPWAMRSFRCHVLSSLKYRYTYTCICIYTYIHFCIHLSMYIYIYVYVYMYMYICICIYVYSICIYVYVYVYIEV